MCYDNLTVLGKFSRISEEICMLVFCETFTIFPVTYPVLPMISYSFTVQ